jgi:hypothetical protein
MINTWLLRDEYSRVHNGEEYLDGKNNEHSPDNYGK